MQVKLIFFGHLGDVFDRGLYIMVKRRLFTENQIKNPEDFKFAEDYHVATRLMYFAKRVCYVSKPLYCYNRINESSALHNFSSDHYEKERLVNLDIIAFFIKFFQEKGGQFAVSLLK